jgi:hypothetical protein
MIADEIEMRSRADDYRERARLLRRAAESGLSADTQRRLLEIADEFDQLAESADRTKLE